MPLFPIQLLPQEPNRDLVLLQGSKSSGSYIRMGEMIWRAILCPGPLLIHEGHIQEHLIEVSYAVRYKSFDFGRGSGAHCTLWLRYALAPK
jgi:hypothetical protein